MHRVYFDSNIFRILKSSHPSYNNDLFLACEEIKQKLLFCFSDAHLDDLKNSVQPYLSEDLALIEKFVGDNYFTYRYFGEKGLQVYLATPSTAFAEKNYVSITREDESLTLEKIFSDLGDDPEIQILNNTVKTLLNIPISAFGYSPSSNASDEKWQEEINKFLPDLTKETSLGEVIDKVIPFSFQLLQNKEKVSELRRLGLSYLNRETYSFEKWKFGFDEKFKDSPFGKSFLETLDSILPSNQENDFHKKFTHAYVMLELLGVTKETKSGGGLKKFTLDSLHRDAEHAYFASYCDFLVTDDRGLQIKAYILYHLFDIQTQVLSSKEFVNLKFQFNQQEESGGRFFTSLKHDLTNSFQLFEKRDILSGDIIRTFITSHNYFNYFNRLQEISSDTDKTWVLFCDRSDYANFFLYREIELLVGKLINTFGNDDELKGVFNLDEINNNEAPIRYWTIGNFKIFLEESDIARGNFLCLVIKKINS